MKLGQIARLAGADLRHDRLVSLCMVASLVAVIAPLLLLFGLKHGVISTMRDQLLNDPHNLEIRLLNSGSYDQTWVDALAQHPQAGFVIGLTRSLNTQADLLRSGAQFLENADVLPTASGDPLMAGLSAPAAGAVVLSAQAATRLGANPGDTLRMRVSRRLEGRDQRAMVPLIVHAVLAPSAYPRPAAFVQPELLRDMEWYRDGYAALGAEDGQPLDLARQRFAKARVYARDIDAVEALERHLNDMRIETTSRLAEIDKVKAIDHLLSTVFGVIAGTGVLGCLASLAGAFLANIRRKRRDIAVLRLIGLEGRQVNLYIVIQALILTAIAFVLGLGVYFAGSAIFNHLLGLSQDTQGFICRITPQHALIALTITLAVALLVSQLGALSARRIQPAESLREI
ncbi:ABC transporter permease [Bordetella avium]|uniref:ABC transporter, transmembrane protein n=1 Tax=Bordetella avium (strain 197N) TaxID=360910 RepID=Q2KWM2_BORA1|nr:ABC transporter permease [Bordetella avium]CAJ48408.1 putative ABC transporter, transmembrane protein [Bordetella avium 197N]